MKRSIKVRGIGKLKNTINMFNMVVKIRNMNEIREER